MAAYYHCEDYNDASGVGRTLTNSSSTIVVAKFANGIQTEQSKNCYRSTDNFGYTGGAFTMSYWYKHIAAPAGQAVMLDLAENTNKTRLTLVADYYYNPAHLNFNRSKYGVGSSSASININLSTTTFWHLCGTYDGASLNLYLNGSLVNGPIAASGNGSGGDYNNRFTVGIYYLLGTVYYIKGIFDEIVLENRAWTAAEIKHYYEMCKGSMRPTEYQL